MKFFALGMPAQIISKSNGHYEASSEIVLENWNCTKPQMRSVKEMAEGTLKIQGLHS